MKNPSLVGSVVLAAALFLTGCGGAIPRPYQGRFEGGTQAQHISVDVESGHVSLQINEKSVELKTFVQGFTDSVAQVEAGQGGVFVLPAIESFQGESVSENPWIPRVDGKAAGLEISEQLSNRFDDIYVVIPRHSIEGKVNDFAATVFHTRIDLQQNEPVASVDADIAPKAEVSALDTDFLGLVRTRVLSFSPLPKGDPELTRVTLQRTL